MERGNLNLAILSLFFLIVSIISFFDNTLITHLILLILGLTIFILITNKITKTNNKLKLKIFFSFIASLSLFLLVYGIWILGKHIVDGFGFVLIIVFYTSMIFGIINFVIGLVLSIKRKNRKDFSYNLKPLLKILSLFCILIILILVYNPLIISIAPNKIVCSMASSPLNKAHCLQNLYLKTLDETICEEFCEIKNYDCTKSEFSCYARIAPIKKDVNICIIGYQKGANNMAGCVSNVARETQDVSLCELIGDIIPEGDLYTKDFCLNEAARYDSKL